MNIKESVNYALTVIAPDVVLSRMAMIQRLTMIAANRFVSDNYYSTDRIESTERAIHYGLKIGDVRRVAMKLNSIPVNEAAMIIRQCNKEIKQIYS